MSRILVMGDIHGAHKALMQCLERCGFSDDDLLIQLGDICDGWSEVYECVEELLRIKYKVCIKGNHDDWFTDFLLYGKHGVNWEQGGIGTLKSYLNNCLESEHRHIHKSTKGYSSFLKPSDIPPEHLKFFLDQELYHIQHNNLFVHGGFNRHELIENQPQETPHVLYWDRDLWYAAMSYESMAKGDKISKFKNANDFDEIYIGHTSTTNWGFSVPIKAANIFNLDTGAGWDGKLTIIDAETKDYWQSDNVKELYPNEKGRT